MENTFSISFGVVIEVYEYWIVICTVDMLWTVRVWCGDELSYVCRYRGGDDDYLLLLKNFWEIQSSNVFFQCLIYEKGIEGIKATVCGSSW